VVHEAVDVEIHGRLRTLERDVHRSSRCSILRTGWLRERGSLPESRKTTEGPGYLTKPRLMWLG
jgi:hypothetical protein